MKKLLPLLSFILLIVFQAHAQIPVGAKAGINWNSFRGNKNFDVIPGICVGGFARYNVLPFLTAKGELLFFQQGANLIDYTVIPGNLEHRNAQVVFNSIQIPLIAEFGLPSLLEEDLQPKISLGGFYSWNFYSRERYTNSAIIPGYERVNYDGHMNATSQFQRNQFGLVGGVGADLKVFSMPVFLEFRYTHNLTPITKPGMTTRYNLENTFNTWNKDTLSLGTLSFNVSVTIHYL